MSGGQDDASNDIESSGGNTIKCPHCSETLDYDERGRNWLCERCGILWSSKLWSHRMSQRKAEIEREMCEGMDELVDTLKEENDAMEDELDLSKPCEATHDGGKWFPTVGPPVFDRSEHYGCFREDIGGVLSFCWYPRARIRNIRSPQYDPHTMETLLPLAGEWVHLRGNSLSVIPFSKITHGDVILDGMSRSYQRLADDWLWATGPHAGKPVAREVVSK